MNEAEKKQFAQFVKDNWLNVGINTSPIDFESAKELITEAYVKAELPAPQFFIGPVNDPYEAALAEKILNDIVAEQLDFDDADHLNRIVLMRIGQEKDRPKQKLPISSQMYGYQEYWVAYYDFLKKHPEISDNKDETIKSMIPKVAPLIELTSKCGWWTPLNDVVIIQKKAESFSLDDQGRLNNINGPAVSFGKDSQCNVYAVRGVRVTKKIIDRDYTYKDIDTESNAEVRRVMIELYGQDKYIIDSKATVVHSDDFGTLYRKELEGDEPLMMVKVVNSTPEPDGSYKDYWIRVDPNAYGGLKTARAAVASTFRNPEDGSLMFASPDDYDCLVET